MRLAVGIGSPAFGALDSPVPRCLTAIATLPWCACASGASTDSKEEGSLQRHKGHKDENTRREKTDFFIIFRSFAFLVFLLLCALCALCAFVVQSLTLSTR